MAQVVERVTEGLAVQTGQRHWTLNSSLLWLKPTEQTGEAGNGFGCELKLRKSVQHFLHILSVEATPLKQGYKEIRILSVGKDMTELRGNPGVLFKMKDSNIEERKRDRWDEMRLLLTSAWGDAPACLQLWELPSQCLCKSAVLQLSAAARALHFAEPIEEFIYVCVFMFIQVLHIYCM